MQKDYQYQIVMKDLSQFSKIYFVPLSDWHIGDRDTDIEKIVGYRDWIKNHDNAFTIFNGDMMNCAWKDSTPELYEDLCTPDQAYEQLVELALPIKDKILMMTSGGHEGSIFRKVGHDYSAQLANDLGKIPYKPDGGMLGIKLSLHNNSRVFFVYATHGWGGARTIGAKVKKVQDLAQVADVDIYVLSHDHCVSEDTEILTEFGWTTHDNVFIGEKALTYNMETNELEYQPIRMIYKYDNFTRMVHVQSRSIDALVTPMHDMVLKNHDGRQWHKETALALSRRLGAIKLPQAGKYKARGVHLSNQAIALVAWIISEGHFHSDSNGIRIHQLEGKHRTIQALLDDLEISYQLVWTKTKKNKNYATFNIHAKDGKWIRQIVSEKRVPESFQELTESQFEVFLTQLCRGGGWFNKWSRGYSTNDSVLAGQLQALGLKHGYRVTDTLSGNMHNLYFSAHPIAQMPYGRKKAKLVPYKGKAWCVNVPNGTIVTRRNGKILIMGNTQNVNRLNILRPPRSKLSCARPIYMQVDRKLMVNTGGFVRYNGYIRRKGYVPQDLGTPRIRLEVKKSGDDYKKDLHASI